MKHITSINQNGATSGFEVCFGPSTLGAGPNHVSNPALTSLTHISLMVAFFSGLFQSAISESGGLDAAPLADSLANTLASQGVV